MQQTCFHSPKIKPTHRQMLQFLTSWVTSTTSTKVCEGEKKQVCTYNPAVLLHLEGEKKRLEKEHVNRIGKNHIKTLGPTMETRMLLDKCKHRRLEIFTTNLRHAITELHPITPYQWESWMEIHPRLILCEEILHRLGYLKHSNQWEKTSTLYIYIYIIYAFKLLSMLQIGFISSISI